MVPLPFSRWRSIRYSDRLHDFSVTIQLTIMYLFKKLNYNGVRGTGNNWFSSYLKIRTQFVSTDGYSSDLHLIHCGVPQGSILRPLLFLIYINDLHYAIKHYKVHHFVDDTNLLNFSCSIKKIKKQVNYDLKNLNNWLNANKFCVNVSKTEVSLFKSPAKQTNSDLHLKLNGKELYPKYSAKYLGIIIDKNLNWNHQINNVAGKLNRANAMSSKIRHFVN